MYPMYGLQMFQMFVLSQMLVSMLFPPRTLVVVDEINLPCVIGQASRSGTCFFYGYN
jgi:hypothetical protein